MFPWNQVQNGDGFDVRTDRYLKNYDKSFIIILAQVCLVTSSNSFLLEFEWH